MTVSLETSLEPVSWSVVANSFKSCFVLTHGVLMLVLLTAVLPFKLLFLDRRVQNIGCDVGDTCYVVVTGIFCRLCSNVLVCTANTQISYTPC